VSISLKLRGTFAKRLGRWGVFTGIDLVRLNLGRRITIRWWRVAGVGLGSRGCSSDGRLVAQGGFAQHHSSAGWRRLRRGGSMGGAWWRKAGGLRWKEALISGPHLSVSQRERESRREGEEVDQAGGRWAGQGVLGCVGKEKEIGREERERGGGSSYKEKEREFFFFKTGYYRYIS
jgi:hypothetical protein